MHLEVQRVQYDIDISKLKRMLIHKIVQIKRSKLHQENVKSQFKNVTNIIWQNVSTNQNIPEENENGQDIKSQSYNGFEQKSIYLFCLIPPLHAVYPPSVCHN